MQAQPGRPLRSVVKNLVLPVACFACIAWVAGFVLIYLRLPEHNMGIKLLVVVAAVVLSFPWAAFVLSVVRRMGRDEPGVAEPQGD